MEELLTEILAVLKNNNAERLWTISDIAFYTNMSSSSVSRNLLCKPGFPTPIKFSDERGRQWIPEEVKEWILSSRQCKKTGRPRNT